MKRASLLGVLGLALGFAGCYTDVEPGFVGLRIHKTGGDRGVEHQPYTGRVWTSINVDVKEFPVTVQNVLWSQAPHDGSTTDESITFAVQGGITVHADIGLNFRIDPNLAWKMYTRYHQTDLAILADGQIRNEVRDCLNTHAGSIQIDGLLGVGRVAFLETVTRCVTERVSPYGVIIENLAFANAPRIPENVQRAINASLEAQQHQSQAEAQARAELAVANGHALAELAAAEGHARAQRAAALGDAEALRIRTMADASHHEAMGAAFRNMQLTPLMTQLIMLRKWNGEIPIGLGSNSMFSFPTLRLN